MFSDLDRWPPCCSSWPTSRSPQDHRAYVPYIGERGAVQPRPRPDAGGQPALHRPRRRALGQDPDARRGGRRGAPPAALGRRRPRRPRRRRLRRRRGGPARPPPADQVHPRRRARPLRPAPRSCRWPAGLGPLPRQRSSRPTHVAARRLRLMRDPEMPPIKASRRHDRLGLPRHARGHRAQQPSTSSSRRPRPRCSSCASTPTDIKVAKARDWGYHGIVAYSKICTHVGCPVGLYEQQTHHLLCPCHQSTFDVTRGLQGHLRPGQAAAAAAEDHRRRRGIPRRARRRSMKPWARASGSVDEHHNQTRRARPACATDDSQARHHARPGSPGRRRRRRLGGRPHRRRASRSATC